MPDSIAITADDTLYIWCMGYDADSNALGDTSVSWSVDGSLNDLNLSASFAANVFFHQEKSGTGYLYARYGGSIKDLVFITIMPGTLAQVVVRDSSLNRGCEVESLNLETGQVCSLYLAGYDFYGNYREDLPGTWSSLQAAYFFAYTGQTCSVYPFNPQMPGSGRLIAGYSGLYDTTGIITVFKNSKPAVTLAEPTGMEKTMPACRYRTVYTLSV